MIRAFTLLIAFSLYINITWAGSITGVVKDARTHETLISCNVALPGTGLGAVTDVNGRFTINVPDDVQAKVLVATYTGYKNDTIAIKNGIREYAILLRPTHKTLEGVVVTGVSKATQVRENPLPVLGISLKKIETAAENNIIDVLVKNAPGLTAVKTGPNISKPFIRGLGYNRVLTLYDGIRQEDQQWGDEHGIEADAYNIEKAEVIKGPASIMYGSDALAGVVSLIPGVPKEMDGKIHGKVLSEYQSNNGLAGNGARLNYSNEHWMWSARGSYRIAKNYTNSVDGRVYNTGFREANAAAMVGYNSKKGYTHLNATYYDNLQGIPDGSRDSLTRRFTKQVAEAGDDIKNRPLVSDNELNSYGLSPLIQHIAHYRAYVNSHYTIGKGDIDGLLALQQNDRIEYNHPTQPQQAGMYVRLKTVNYGVRYNAPEFNNIDLSVGMNGMYQDNTNKDATDFPIPDYNLFDAGAYGYAKWKYDRWTISGGARYDTRRISLGDFYVKHNPADGFAYHATGNDISGATLQFAQLNKTFEGVSVSLGGTYRLSEAMSLKGNIARGYRAPNITEVASNGLDPGAHIVYLGNRNFIPEFSVQEDLGISGGFDDFSFTACVFNNDIQNYIYLTQLVDANGAPVIIVPGNRTFQYQQATARLHGAELSLDIHPEKLKGFSWDNQFAVTYGFNRKQDLEGKKELGGYLPLIPPMKLLSTVQQSVDLKSKTLQSVTGRLEMDYSAAQNRYLALYSTETPTPAFTLWNVGASADIVYAKGKTLQVQLQLNNIFDTAYLSHLSRLKYFEYYTASPNGKMGIYGMGRNACVKVIVGF